MGVPKKTKNGRWRIRVVDKSYSDGKRHYKSFTANSKKEALYLASEFEVSQKKSEMYGNTYDDLTLREAYIRYIEAKSKTLSPSTYREYKREVERDFPNLMNTKLRNITPELVQTAISEACASFSPKTVRNMHGLLYAVLKAYKPNLQLTTNLPQAEEKDIYVPTSDEVKKCIETADEFLRVPILLASSGGLRRSEISALTPDDVTDLGVSITKATVYDENKDLVVKPPKTKSGNRFCPLSKEIVREVKAWKHFGISPGKIEHEFQKLKKELGLNFKFHSFRHYFASELHAQGIPDQYIAKAGGWKSVATLQKIYQHTLRDKEKIYNDKIVNIFSKNLSQKEKEPLDKKA